MADRWTTTRPQLDWGCFCGCDFCWAAATALVDEVDTDDAVLLDLDAPALVGLMTPILNHTVYAVLVNGRQSNAHTDVTRLRLVSSSLSS